MAKFCHTCEIKISDNPKSKVKFCQPCGVESERKRSQGDYLSKKIKIERGLNCEQCGKACKKGEIDGHHKIPLAEGGENTPDNMILLCGDCHKEQHYG